MSSKNNKVTRDVLDCKEELGKELLKLQKYSDDPNSLSKAFYDRVSDLLDRLEKLPIDLSVLSSTLIGTVVSKFKTCSSEQVGLKSKKLIKKWKLVAKNSQQGKPQQSSPAPVKAGTVAKSSTKSASSSGSGSLPEPKEWCELPQLRKNICNKLYTLLKSACDEGGKDESMIPICTAIENEVQKFSKGDRLKYAEKSRSLLFNLKKNQILCQRLASSELSPSELCKMTPEQLATAEKIHEKKQKEKKLQDARLLNWEQNNEDKINDMCGIKGDLKQASLFTCGRCKSTKTTSTQKQTRSADEPMTVFVFCINCGNRWKC